MVSNKPEDDYKERIHHFRGFSLLIVIQINKGGCDAESFKSGIFICQLEFMANS